MKVLKRRSHVIYFRISEDEFEHYTRLCQTAGARSVSDLARSAVNRMLEASETASGQAAIAAEIAGLNQQLETVTVLLKTVTQLLKDERRPYGSAARNDPRPERE